MKKISNQALFDQLMQTKGTKISGVLPLQNTLLNELVGDLLTQVKKGPPDGKVNPLVKHLRSFYLNTHEGRMDVSFNVEVK